MAHANGKLTLYGRRLIVERLQLGWTQTDAAETDRSSLGDVRRIGACCLKQRRQELLGVNPHREISGADEDVVGAFSLSRNGRNENHWNAAAHQLCALRQRAIGGRGENHPARRDIEKSAVLNRCGEPWRARDTASQRSSQSGIPNDDVNSDVNHPHNLQG